MRDTGGRPDLFATMNAVAESTGAINLGHGYTDEPPLPVMVDAAVQALRHGGNHYTSSAGSSDLRLAISDRLSKRGLPYDPDLEVTVTAGCTEAIAAAVMAFAPPGSSVLAVEPYYDLYSELVEMAGAHLTCFGLRGFGTSSPPSLDLEAMKDAILPTTKVLLLNSPHNPSGLQLTLGELNEIASLATKHDLTVISDEAYDEFVYGDAPHVSIAAIEAMRDRTIVCSSITKTLSVSGWRVGWACASALRTGAIRNVHRVLSYCAPAPLQAGAAAGLAWADSSGYYQDLRADYRRRRDIVVGGLRRAGLIVDSPKAGQFVVADVSAWAEGTSMEEFAVRLAHEAGVVALPITSSVATPELGQNVLRFAFCKAPHLLEEAATRLSAFGASRSRA